MIKVKLTGRVRARRFTYYRGTNYISESSTYGYVLDLYNVWEGEIDNPPLQVGEWLYVEELNQKFKIEDVVRSTGGGYIHLTDAVKTIDDEHTENSKRQAEEQMRKWKEYEKKKEEEDMEKALAELERERKSKEKKWYQFWK